MSDPPVSVALIGFMGAGKSHVGMLLAPRLRLPFVDTDTLIAEELGSIESVFAERGEAFFRSVERDVAIAVLEQSGRVPGVISVGGGAVLDEGVRAALSRLRHVVWLTAAVEVLFSRAAEGGRPLAQDPGGFARLYEERRALYERLATAVVVNDGARPLDAVVDEIVTVTRG